MKHISKKKGFAVKIATATIFLPTALCLLAGFPVQAAADKKVSTTVSRIGTKRQNPPQPKNPYRENTLEAPLALGSIDAEIGVYLFGSVACRRCANWYQENYSDFSHDYVETGVVRYAFLEMAASEDGDRVNFSQKSDELAHCLANREPTEVEKARIFHLSIQHMMAAKAARLTSEKQLEIIGNLLNYSNSQTLSCINSETNKHKSFVRLNAVQDTAAATYSIDTAPYFLVFRRNGPSKSVAIKGEMSMQRLVAAIEQLNNY